MAESVQHGLIQKARRSAQELRPKVTQTPGGFKAWIWSDEQWVYLGTLTYAEDAVAVILSRLGQEER